MFSVSVHLHEVDKVTGRMQEGGVGIWLILEEDKAC